MSQHATPLPRYPPNTHKLDRMSRTANVLRWVQMNVKEDGGQATFVGFGRSARRTFGKIQAMLPDEYEAMIRIFKQESNSFRHSRDEVQLRVTHRDAPWPPQAIHPIYSENPGRSVGDSGSRERPT